MPTVAKKSIRSSRSKRKPKSAIQPNEQERGVLLREYAQAMIRAGFAADLPDSYLPKHLRWSAVLGRWRKSRIA